MRQRWPTAAAGAVGAAVAGMVNAETVAIMARFGDRAGVVPTVAFVSVLGGVITVLALVLIDRGIGRLVAGLRAPL